MVERIGYIVATENFAADQQTDGEVMGLGFMPCEPSGEPWSPKQEAKSEKLGFKKVLAVVSNVTRWDGKIHHEGIQAHFLKTVSDEFEAKLRTIPESVIVGIVNRFYDDMAAALDKGVVVKLGWEFCAKCKKSLTDATGLHTGQYMCGIYVPGEDDETWLCEECLKKQ